MNLVVAGFCFIFGCILWTFVEYFLHRFAGHEILFRPKLYLFILRHFRKEHQKHHFIRGFFGETSQKLIATIIILFLMAIAMTFIFDLYRGVFISAGFASMYLTYELFHRFIHVRKPRSKVGKILRKHHLYHHFMDSSKNHGVTTKIWDKVFGTFVETSEILVEVNQRFVFPWMLENGVLATELESDYILLSETKFH